MSRVRRFLDELRTNYAHELTNVHRYWENNRLEFILSVRGFQIQGTLVVEENEVCVTGLLQLGILLFRKRIEETIELELSRLLQPTVETR